MWPSPWMGRCGNISIQHLVPSCEFQKPILDRIGAFGLKPRLFWIFYAALKRRSSTVARWFRLWHGWS